uniref:Uncharacterized protein n=1 Tax=viral metagenome TaxID=1070528 RepID=A0A6C0AZK0_9ZZZZ
MDALLNLFKRFFEIKIGPVLVTYQDFSCQFDSSCLTWEPSEKVCGKHGPIKFIREDFGGCVECNDKWRAVVYPKK